jgi:hypothetical protein
MKAGAVAALGVSMTLLPAASNAVGATPGIALRTVLPEVTALRFEGDPSLYLSSGVYAAATNGTFQVLARRGADGAVTLSVAGKALKTPRPVDMWSGIPGFFDMSLKNAKGKTVSSQSTDFCPAGWYGSSRVDSSGPSNPTFPYECGTNLTQAIPWGIDKGWATPISVFFDGTAIPDGSYTATIAVASTYVRQLALDTRTSTVTFKLTVVTDPGGECPPDVPCKTRRVATSRQEAGPLSVRGVESNGSAGTAGAGRLPNLSVLPAHDLFVENLEGRDQLEFGATLWNAGPGPLVIEGFRQGADDLMTATQFLYENGQAVSNQVIGSFQFDRRPGHFHWHFLDAARYDLLDSAGSQVLLSGKQSFCLAPTDPIDLLVDGADLQPDRLGLWSACGGEDGIWIREVMPVGWGDTYFQYVAGQSFDVTDLPNGTYKLRVTTNPENVIRETSYADNTALLTVTLGGSPGARTVTSSAITR